MKVQLPRHADYDITVLLVELPESRVKMSFGPEHAEANVELPDGVKEEDVEVWATFQGCPDEPYLLKPAALPKEKDDEDAPDEDAEEAGEEAAPESPDAEADREVGPVDLSHLTRGGRRRPINFR